MKDKDAPHIVGFPIREECWLKIRREAVYHGTSAAKYMGKVLEEHCAKLPPIGGIGQ